jgi:hypothetical protein
MRTAALSVTDGLMNTHFLNQIDWSRPWLASVRTLGVGIAQAPDWRHELNRRAREMNLCNARSLPIRFVPQSDLPPDMAYETFIANTGCVPTRENLHDFFNALVWLTFPLIKIQLNALQAGHIEKSTSDGSAGRRGKLRDAATIFDENAILLVTSNHELVTALRAHEWMEVFAKRRSEFVRDCSVLLFGHALMEKLLRPYKAITGHVWLISLDMSAEQFAPDEQAHQVDVAVARQLAQGLSTADFSPLPVLGVPGWWPDQDEFFYQDAAVFRPKRS